MKRLLVMKAGCLKLLNVQLRVIFSCSDCLFQNNIQTYLFHIPSYKRVLATQDKSHFFSSLDSTIVIAEIPLYCYPCAILLRVQITQSVCVGNRYRFQGAARCFCPLQ